MFENYIVPKNLIPSDPRFGCGPSLIPPEHLQSLVDLGPHLMGTSHRKTPIKNLQAEIHEGLRSYFDLDFESKIIMANGGATMLFDMIGLGATLKSSAHFTCGEFSHKWFEAHQKNPWIEAKEFSADIGSGIEAHEVDGCDLTALTLNETSTGVISPTFPKLKNSILAVDGTSGLGQVRWPVNKTDIMFFSPQKVFASEGGLALVIASREAQERIEKIERDEKRYIPDFMNWTVHFQNAAKMQTLTTPSISTLFLLNEQLKKMTTVGYSSAQELALKKSKLIYNWAESKEYLSPYIKDEKFRSTAVATIDVDEKINVKSLLKSLADQKVVYGIDSYRKLNRNQFRISMFHNVTFENLEILTKLLSHAIESAL